MLVIWKTWTKWQKFSGEKWTDYNYHDPGITLLEQICYAITDLGYKSNFAKNACSKLQKKGEFEGELEDIIKKALKEIGT